MHERDWEIASRPLPLEYGGGGFVTSVNGRKVAPPSMFQTDADDFVIQGFAIRWNSLIRVNDDEYAWFGQNSIRMDGNVKRLHFDHDESRTIATTKDGLILVADEDGLAMRFYPRDSVAIHREAVESVRENGRTALSVGVTMHSKQFETFNGKPVRIVRDATLNEISLVMEGACKEAYCTLIRKDQCNALLADDVKSKRVLADGGYAGVMRALQRLEARYSY
jgi:phage head maturation protease